MQLFEERQQRVVVVGVPLRRNRPDDLIQGAFGHVFFDALKPRREGLHSRDALVDAVARVKTAQRSVRKIPFLVLKQKPWSIIFFL
jgi:hypothetical protein